MKMLYDLEMQLASKQKLELEREQLRGNLEVRKHMAEEDAKSKEMLDKLHEELKGKDEEMEGIDSMNQALIIQQRRTNDELEEAKKELITV
jgi:archaellum biogenesis ATPase FlaH